jgi:hypothetical protein
MYRFIKRKRENTAPLGFISAEVIENIGNEICKRLQTQLAFDSN